MDSKKTSYSIAAARHNQDGKILLSTDRIDNAMCHFAFSAECSLKAFWEAFQEMNNRFPKVKFVHKEKELNEFLRDYYWLTVWNPTLAFLSGLETIPNILFQDHPDRRYYDNQNYTAEEIKKSEHYSDMLLQRLVECALDGQYNMQYDI